MKTFVFVVTLLAMASNTMAAAATGVITEEERDTASAAKENNVQWTYGDVPLDKGLRSVIESRRLLNPRAPWGGHGRRLAALTEMNEMLKGVTLHISEVMTNTDTVEFKLHDLKCTNIAIEDLTLSSAMAAAKNQLDLTLQLTGVNVDCTIKATMIDVPWYVTLAVGALTWSSLSDGDVLDGSATTSTSSLTSVVGFSSSDFARFPPSTIEIGSCNAGIKLDDFKVHKWSKDFLDYIPFYDVTAELEKKVGEALCDSGLATLGSSTLTPLAQDLTMSMNPYLPCACAGCPPTSAAGGFMPWASAATGAGGACCVKDGGGAPACAGASTTRALCEAKGVAGAQWCGALHEGVHDALWAEGQPPVAAAAAVAGRLMDFGGMDGDLVDVARQGIAWLSEPDAADPSAGPGINQGVRALLGEGGRFTLDVADLFKGGQILEETTNPVAHTSIYLTNVSLAGLDSFTRFQPFNVIGAQTIEFDLALAELDFEVGLTIHLRPSGADGAVLNGGGEVLEHVTTRAGVRGLALNMATLLAFERARVEGTKIGSLVPANFGGTGTLTACAVATLLDARASRLAATLDDVTRAGFAGFAGPGIDHLFTGLGDAVYLMFEGPLKLAMPNLFEVDVRDAVNNAIAGAIADARTGTCVLPAAPASPPTDLFNFATDPTWNWATTTIDAYLGPASGFEVNTILIPAAGFAFAAPAAPFELAAGDSFKLGIALENLSFKDIASVYDLAVLAPAGASDPQGLVNRVKLAKDVPMAVGIDVALTLEGGTGAGAVSVARTFALMLSARQVALLLDVGVRISKARALNVDLGGAARLPCWLAALVQDADNDGLRVAGGALTFGAFVPSIACVACKHADAKLAAQNAAWLADGGAATAATVNAVLADVFAYLTGEVARPALRAMVANAARECAGLEGTTAPTRAPTAPAASSAAAEVAVPAPAPYATEPVGAVVVAVLLFNRSERITFAIGVSESVSVAGFMSVEFDVTDFACDTLEADLTVASVGPDAFGAPLVEMTVAIGNLNAQCALSWAYRAGTAATALLTDAGTVAVSTANSKLTVRAQFTSTDFALQPPSGATLKDCVSAVDFAFSMTSEGLTAVPIAEVDAVLQAIVKSEAERLVCDELRGLVDNALAKELLALSASMAPYLPCPCTGAGGAPLAPAATACPRHCAFAAADADVLALERAMAAAGPLPPTLVALNENYVVASAQELIEDSLGPATAADGTVTLGVNALVRQGLLDDDGTFRVDVSTFVEGGTVYGAGASAPLTVALKEARIGGLDTFTAFSPFAVEGAYTVAHAAALARLTVALDVAVTVRPANTGALDAPGPLTNAFEVSAGVSGLSLNMAELIAVDAARVDAVHVGSLVPEAYGGAGALLPCLATTAHGLGFARLNVGVDDLTMPAVSGLGGTVIAGLDAAASDLLRGVEMMFEGSALRALPALVETSVRADLNAQVDALRASAAAECRAPAAPKTGNDTEYFRFGGNTLWASATAAFDEYLGAGSGFKVNELLIGPETQKASGVAGALVWPGVDGIDVEAGPLGRLAFDVGEIRLSGLDTVHEMKLLEPATGAVAAGANGPYTLTNRIGLGKAPPVVVNLASVKFSIKGGTGTATHDIDNELKLSLTMKQVLAVADFLVKVDIGKVFHRRLSEVTNVDCWLATLGQLEVSALALSFARFAPAVECVKCSSPKMQELSANLNDDANVAELTKSMNEWIRYLINEFKGPGVDKTIDDAVRAARLACPTPGNQFAAAAEATPPPTPLPAEPETNILNIVAPVAGATFAAVCICCVRFRRERRAGAAAAAAARQDPAELAEQRRKDAGLRASRSLFRSVNVIPRFARWFIPIVLMVNIGFFVSGHIALGASVDINIEVAGETILIPKFFEFSLAKSTIDMYEAGAIPLAVLIVVFSGLWPYTKMLLMLFCWFAGPGCLGPRKRGAIFIWLDVLGKWSMIDIFVLFVSLVSFRLHMESPSTLGFLPRGFYTVDLGVVPMWGLYANLLAQLMSQFVSHAAIYYHRNVVAAAEALTQPDDRPSCMPGWMCRLENGKCVGLPTIKIGTPDEEGTDGGGAARMDRTRARRNSYAPHARGSKMKRANSREPRGDVARARLVDAYAPASPRTHHGHATPRSVDFVERPSAEWTDNPLGAGATRAAQRTNPLAARARARRNRAALRTAAARARIQRSRRASTWLEAGTAVDGEVAEADVALADVKEALCYHVFEMGGRGRRFRITRTARWALLACVASSCGLIVAGCAVPGFWVEAAGLVGVFMDFGQGDGARVKRLSIFGVADIIAAHAGDTFESAAGIYLLGLVFVFCSMVVPLTQLGAVTVLWVRPMTLAQQKKMFVVNEILSAWQYLEVYLIAIVVAVMQLGQISGFMVGEQCEALEPVLDSMEQLGVIPTRDATCFEIHSGILSGAYLLLAGAVLLNISTQFVTRGAASAMADREARNRGRPATPKTNCFTWFVWRGMREVTAALQPQASPVAAGEVELTEAAIVAKQAAEIDMAKPQKKKKKKTQALRIATSSHSGALPQFWEKLVDQESGRDYFFNHRTGESSWDRPLNAQELAAQLAVRQAAETPRPVRRMLRKQSRQRTPRTVARQRAISRAAKPKLAVNYESKEEEPVPETRKRGTTAVSIV